MSGYQYGIERPVRVKRGWAVVLAGLAGLGMGAAATFAYIAYVVPPAPVPKPVVIKPSCPPLAPVHQEFDSAPLVSTLRIDINDLITSLGSMPTLNSPAYKTPFSVIEDRANTLEKDMQTLELALDKHKSQK